MTRKVLMSEELFHQLGAVYVDWGKPDLDGFYTPTIYRSFKEDEADVQQSRGAREAIAKIRQAWKDYGIHPVGRIARGINEVEATYDENGLA